MTLWILNEADIIDANIAFHLAAGVDLILVADNGSEDGTIEILDRYAKQGFVHLIDDPSAPVSQIDSVTRMARLAATNFGADWVINNDADEFWWPREGTLKDIFAAVPQRFGAVRGMWRHFVPRPFGDTFFAERMTVRLCAPVMEGDHTFNPHFKTAHRGDPEVSVGGGNHDALGRVVAPLSGWYPIDVLHFPLRSLEQCERRFVYRAMSEIERGAAPDPRRMDALTAYRRGRLQEFYDSHLVNDDVLQRGLRDGTLALDTRLRDALRSLPVDSEQVSRAITLRRQPTFDSTPLDAAYLAELGSLEEQGELARAERRAGTVEQRLSRLESSSFARLGSYAPRLIPQGAARHIVTALAGIAAFAVTAGLVEAFTDRDWSLSGPEWPADFVTAAALVCLVPLVFSATNALRRIGRRGVRRARIRDRAA